MQKKFKTRSLILIAAIVCLFAVLLQQTGMVTLTQGGDLSNKSQQKIQRAVSVDGARGDITDVNGVPLAYDQTSYDVQVLHDPARNSFSDRAYYTNIFIQAIDIIQKNGGKVIDTFSIARNENGDFSFDFGAITPEQAAAREANWRTNMFVSKGIDAKTVYQQLRDRYRIPENASYAEARKLLSIWQEVQLSSYRAYVPVTIAKDVNPTTVAQLEERTAELDGVQVAAGTKRVYPKDDVAAHTIGYTGKMSDQDTIKKYTDQGYTQDNTIGITGIENWMEQYLTGNITERQGKTIYEVDSKGKVIKEIGSEPATKGDNVMLTLDLQLQMQVEQALAKNVQDVNVQQHEKYAGYTEKQRADVDKALNGRQLNYANSGAMVVMDVKTGNVLAMSSYPSFDLNLFTGGISKADFDKLNDPVTTPLFNKAIASKGIPGSIFKMVTGLAGLEEGKITLDTQISDEGPYTAVIQEGFNATAPQCYIAPYFDEHKNLTIKTALQVSCDYFFYEVANRLKIDLLDKWAQKFGLTDKTGIQLPGEIAGQAGGAKALFDIGQDLDHQKTALPQIVYNAIVKYLKENIAQARNVQYSDEVIKQTATKLVQLADQRSLKVGEQVRQVLFDNMEVPTQVSRIKGYDNDINNWVSELVWDDYDTVITGIGSGVTAVTPIAVARYVSALVNGGTVYQANILDRVTDANGNVVLQQKPEVFGQLDANPEYLEAIKEGMKAVVSAEDGTASKALDGWKYKDFIGGKTGTAVVTKGVEIEDNAWFVAFAPYDNPEIAVVTFIPTGLGGAYAIPSVKQVIEYYMDRKNPPADNNVPSPNSVVPNLNSPAASASPSASPSPSSVASTPASPTPSGTGAQ